MPEDLNQINDSVDTDEDLFNDWTPDASDSTPDDDDEVEDQPSLEVEDNKEVEEKTSDTSVQPVPDFLKIKYNKEEKSLTKDEAVEYAQKGMNYDNILGKYNSLKENEPRLSQLSQLAEANGMTIDEFITNLNEAQKTRELNQEIKELENVYPNADRKLLEELAKAHMNDKSTSLMAQRQEKERTEKERVGKMIDEFTSRYPNVDVRQIISNPEVASLMKSGKDLTKAYLIYQEDQRIAQEKITRQNEDNKKRSLGNTNNTGYSEEDEFIRELFSD